MRPSPDNALAQRVYDIDDVLRLRCSSLAGNGYAGLFLFEQLDDGLLVVVHELRGIEVGRLARQDPLGQLECLGPKRDHVVEVLFGIPIL